MANRQRYRTRLCVWILAAGASLIVIGERQLSGSVASTVQAQMPGPDATALWNYISKDSAYRSWKTLPDLPRYIHVNENPHGDWVAVYVNKEAYESISYRSSPFQMKYGSILVKENYSLTKGDPSSQPPLTSVPVSLTSLTVMYKVKGYQRVADEEEWFWVMYRCQNGQCDGTVATVSDQPWLNEQISVAKDTFAFYKGEVLAGKPWLCVECHQRAKQSDDYAFGDYLWKVKIFAPK